MKAFYEMTENEVKENLLQGGEYITETQIKAHQEKYGWNELAEGKKKTVLEIFLEQFKDFLVILLIGAAVISFFLGETESALVIGIVITINAILGTVQTKKAEQSLEGLKKLSAPNAKVYRNGEIKVIPGREVTVGDIIYVEAGDAIPADGRILTCASLKINESALTGESLSVEKTVETLEGDTPLADRKNMLYSGSFVTYGRGSYIVTNVGMETEVGKIASLLKDTSEKRTPLQVNLDQFGRKLSIVIIVLCGLLFGVQVLNGGNITQAFLFAVALAVAAIPEALTSIVTIVLAFGTQKMAKEGAIMRKLQAVEGLGSVSVICSDKTGTLTKNQMTVENYYVESESVAAGALDTENTAHMQILTYSMLCNDASFVNGKEIGDPTETAMVAVGTLYNMESEMVREQYKRVSEIPFDSDRKMMSTLHDFGEQFVMITKGAVDVMLQRIKYIQENGVVREITKEDQEKIEASTLAYSREGLRVLGIGYKSMDGKIELDLSEEKDLVFLGLISMMDPPREESKEAVAACMKAGIRPIMITGDHKATAAAIAKRIGILKDEKEACEGAEIDALNDEELKGFVENISVYARVTPEHKIRIVRAWQEKGYIVSMTGDGVNDAPALKQADIGVAMGITGTEVSKDAASMVLTDDNFATIVKAIENGRNIYANIKRSIQFLLSGNFAAILVVLIASLFGLPVPFAAVHLLFINLLTDSLPAIALGVEPYKKGVMEEKPRPMNESILTKQFLKAIGLEGAVIGFMTLLAFLYGYQDQNVVLASTMAFAVLCLSRLVHGYNCKSDRPVLFSKQFFNNVYMQGAFVLGFVLLNGVLLIPALSGPFSVQTLNVQQLMIVYGLAILNLPIIQLMKKIKK